jgi:polyisoprenoid-binding protein YceI
MPRRFSTLPVAPALLVLLLAASALAVPAGPALAQPANSLLLNKATAPLGHKASPPPASLLATSPQARPDSPAAPPSTAPSTNAEPGPVLDGATLDSAHTGAIFWIRHIVAPVAGRFNTVSGTIAIAPGQAASGRVDITVATESVDTGIAARDKHLRTADFLDTARYPEMRFASSRIVPAGKGLARVTGKLTIKDVSKEVTIPVRLLGTKPHPMMPCVDVTGYEAAFAIDRLEYHVGTGKFFKMGAVGDVVDIRLAGETLAARPGCVKPQETAKP